MLLPPSLLLLFFVQGKKRSLPKRSFSLRRRSVSILFAADPKFKIVCYFANWGKGEGVRASERWNLILQR